MTHENLMRYAKAYAEGLSDGLNNNSTELDRKTDELIWKQDAIDAINSHFGFNIEEEYGSAVQEVINGLPSAESERKTGKWTIEDVHSATYKYCCSECKAHHRARYDFCPTCGAKMEDE